MLLNHARIDLAAGSRRARISARQACSTIAPPLAFRLYLSAYSIRDRQIDLQYYCIPNRGASRAESPYGPVLRVGTDENLQTLPRTLRGGAVSRH